MGNILNNRYRLLFALLFGFGALFAIFILSPNANAASDIERVNSLEQQAEQLSKQLSSFVQVPKNNIGINAPIKVAQSSASLNVRLTQLEEQIRILRGQVEGLQFQMTQMQTFLERQQEDYEFRFEQLEGGGLGKTKAAPVNIGENANQVVSQDQTELNNQDANDVELDTSEGLVLTDKTLELALPNNINDQASNLATVNDADAQYEAGYNAAISGESKFAQEQFKQFILLYPTHPQAPDATSWLGGELISQGKYQEAADILLNGFQSYSGSKQAPDILLKLGQALLGQGEHATACRTFSEVTRRYPNISNDIKSQLSAAINKAKC